MNKNMNANSVKELGKQLRAVCGDGCEMTDAKKAAINRVTHSLTIFAIQNMLTLTVREFALNTEFLAGMTGYTEKEIKDISRFADKLGIVCAEYVTKMADDESLDDYFYKIFMSLSMIRTKFPVFLWTGVALYLVIEQCAI